MPVVVGKRNCNFHVLCAIAISMSNQRGFVVIMKNAVGDSDSVGSMGNIKKAVVKVLAVISITGKVYMVDPDVGGVLDADCISDRRRNLLDDEVPDNDILDLVDLKADTLKSFTIRSEYLADCLRTITYLHRHCQGQMCWSLLLQQQYH
jgi:hypothetical protein